MPAKKETHPPYRLALLADIHGNLPAFEAVMRALERSAPFDAVLVVGDVLSGPHQQVILERLLEMRAVMVQGNNEQGLARLAEGSAPDYYYTARQYSLTRWVREHLSPAQVSAVCAMPEQRVFTLPGAQPIRMLHGSPGSVSSSVFPDAAAMARYPAYHPTTFPEILDRLPQPVTVFGHTHLPWQACLDGRLGCNPGAVSFSQDGYLGARYALLDWDGDRWTPKFHRARYDLQRVRRDYEDSGFLDCSPLARVILQSILTGRDYLPAYFRHANHIAEAAGCAGLPYYPDEVWDRAAQTYPW